jgi:hypothetical protein
MPKAPKVPWNRDAFAAVVRRHGPNAVAKAIGTAVRTVNHWAAGNSWTLATSTPSRASGPGIPQKTRFTPRLQVSHGRR